MGNEIDFSPGVKQFKVADAVMQRLILLSCSARVADVLPMMQLRH